MKAAECQDWQALHQAQLLSQLLARPLHQLPVQLGAWSTAALPASPAIQSRTIVQRLWSCPARDHPGTRSTARAVCFVPTSRARRAPPPATSRAQPLPWTQAPPAGTPEPTGQCVARRLWHRPVKHGWNILMQGNRATCAGSAACGSCAPS